MKKIVFFCNNMNIGGMEKALLILLNSLCKNYKVTLYLKEKQGILLNDLNTDIIVKELKTSDNSNIIYRKIYNFINRKIFILLNKNKYSFSCNYSTYFPLGSMLALAVSKNSLLYVHSDYYNLYKKDINKIKEFFKLMKLEKFKTIAFVSEEAKKSISNIYPDISNKFKVLSNLVDYENVLKLSNEKINSLNKSNKSLIFIGRLEEESKNLTLLLNIMNKLKKSNIDLIIIGSGKDHNLCEKIIKQNNLYNVTMLGEKTNPYPYLKKADALILTSNFEGYPIVFNEALILNKPIISTLKVTDKYFAINEENALILKNSETEFTEIIKYLNNINNNKEVNFKKINEKRLQDIIDVIE